MGFPKLFWVTFSKGQTHKQMGHNKSVSLTIKVLFGGPNFWFLISIPSNMSFKTAETVETNDNSVIDHGYLHIKNRTSKFAIATLN